MYNRFDVKAEEGMLVSFKKHTYRLIPEVVEKGCKGCALYNNNGCNRDVTDYCRQGFILERIKK